MSQLQINKHLKCDTDIDVCRRCAKSHQVCVRDAPKIKFGRVTGPNTFARDQIWLATPSSPFGLRFLDETTDTISAYRDISTDHNSTQLSHDQNGAGNSTDSTSPAEYPDLSTPTAQIETRTDFPDNVSLSPTMLQSRTGHHHHHHGSLNQPFSPARSYLSGPRSCPSALGDYGNFNQQPSNQISRTKEPSPHENHTVDGFLKAILVRYYTENLGHWFDLNDPLRHFTRIVPLRSRSSRPLLNAILTASARQLVRTRRYRNEAGEIQWQEHILSNLNEELVLQIQNECIRELLDLSSDPEQVMSADLLAAAVVLRTDEEMDALFREDAVDSQVFLGVTHAYIDAQVTCVVSRIPESESTEPTGSLCHVDTRDMRSETGESPGTPSFPVSYKSTHPPAHEYGAYSHSLEENSSRALRQACFWAACRQDVHASMIKQKPINFPLEYCNALRSLAPAEDYVWTIRAIIFCADVLEYCYGRRSGRKKVAPAYTDYGRWQALKQRAFDIAAFLPKSFEPPYFNEPNIEAGEWFPQIWFQDPCYATGTGHIELARILLTVFDPSIPRLGLGTLAAHQEMGRSVRNIILRLCGIAMSNRKNPPNFINAFVAIVSYGEYITDKQEQAAMLRLMDLMQFEFAYYTAHVANGLKNAWHRHVHSPSVDDIYS